MDKQYKPITGYESEEIDFEKCLACEGDGGYRDQNNHSFIGCSKCNGTGKTQEISL